MHLTCKKPFKCVNHILFPKYEQYVVVPTRRSTAEAFQILISHTFGDAGSPYLVGVVSIKKSSWQIRCFIICFCLVQLSEAIKASLRLVNDSGTKIQSLALVAENSTSYISNSTSTGITAYQLFDDTNETKFKALQYSLFTTSFVEVIGGLFFLITAAYILRDKAKAEKAVSGKFSDDELIF